MTTEAQVMQYDRISQDPTNFEQVFRRQLSLADELRQGKAAVDSGDVEGKALHGATRTLETDLRARIFEHRVLVHKQRALPGAREGSDAAALMDQRSQTQAADSTVPSDASGAVQG
jgi:hypothetical protein